MISSPNLIHHVTSLLGLGLDTYLELLVDVHLKAFLTGSHQFP
jgi:hypothetical protein